MSFISIFQHYSISEIRLDPHLAVDTSSGSQYGSRGALAWTPPASNEGSTPTWTEGTPSFTESSSSGDMGNNHISIFFERKFLYFLKEIKHFFCAIIPCEMKINKLLISNSMLMI